MIEVEAHFGEKQQVYRKSGNCINGTVLTPGQIKAYIRKEVWSQCNIWLNSEEHIHKYKNVNIKY